MEIQTIFYTLASIFMLIGIVLLIGVFVVAWRVERSVLAFKKKATTEIESFVNRKKMVGLLSALGLGLKWFMERKNRKSS